MIDQLIAGAKVAEELTNGRVRVDIAVRGRGLIISATEALKDGNRVGFEHLVSWEQLAAGMGLEMPIRVTHAKLTRGDQ